MKKISRRDFLKVSGVTAAAAALAGCGAASSAGTASSAAASTAASSAAASAAYAGTIYWLNYKPEVSEQMKDVAAAYTKETGINVKIETAASNTYEQTLTAEMDKSDAPTIFVVDGSIMLANWKDYCADLTDTDLHSMLNDDTYTMSTDGKLCGISYALESWGIIVNKAITDKYFALSDKATTFTSLDDLYTFANLKAVVEDMQAKKDELGIQGVFGSTSMKSGDDWRYQTHLMNQPLYWEWGADVDLNGEIPEFTFKYADNFKNIYDLYLNNSLIDKKLVGTKTVDDSMAEFALGQCAMIQNGDWAWNMIQNTSGATITPENVCFIPISCGVDGEDKMGLNTGAGQYMCINCKKSDEDQKAALDFLAWLFSSDTGKKLVSQSLQFVTPFKTMSDAEYTNPLFASENAITAAGKTAYPWCANLIPDQTWKDAMGADMLLYAQGQKDWKDVVSDAVANWATEREITNAAK